MTEPTQNSVDPLVHCANYDSRADENSALLMYAGMQTILKANSDGLLVNFELFWSLRERIYAGPIRLMKRNPITTPERRPPIWRQYLAIPNTTTLNSSSKWVLTASQHVAHEPLLESKLPRPLGDTIHASCSNHGYYDAVLHLVCRTPGDPRPRALSQCFESFGAVLVQYVIPLFGREDDWATWRDALVVWTLRRRNIQSAACFLDICYAEETELLAHRISEGLKAVGVKAAISAGA
jgi:hypothetical protein